ncbi:MAG: SDR family oxidoreductase [Gemmatimonadota bacterium]|jgi:3-oxoacyl-[acyl-carrier protein] reductase
MNLAGKVILVTGGSRGIGRACVLDAVARGARVVFCSRHDGPERRQTEATAAAVGGADAAIGLTTDVSDETSVTRLFEEARQRFGPLHGVVNNAAVSRESLLVSTTTEDWDAVIAVNLTGGFLVAREALRTFLEEGRGGRIVSIGTVSLFGISGNASYATGKGGLAGLTRQINRQHAGDGIVAAMVIPGYVETTLSAGISESARQSLIDGCPMRRPGSPEETASVVSFLLSDASAGIETRTLFASGGLREAPP